MFFRGSALQGGCVDIKGLAYCSAGMSQTGNVTTFAISSLSKKADEGDWRCKYGTLSSIAETLTVYSMNYIFSSVQPNTWVMGLTFSYAVVHCLSLAIGFSIFTLKILEHLASAFCTFSGDIYKNSGT